MLFIIFYIDFLKIIFNIITARKLKESNSIIEMKTYLRSISSARYVFRIPKESKNRK